MITKMHFKYIGPDGFWRSACSFKGWYEDVGVSGDHQSTLLIRHRHSLAAHQIVNCQTCLKNPELKKLLEELSPWPDPSLYKERMAALMKPVQSVKVEITPEYREQLRQLYRMAPR